MTHSLQPILSLLACPVDQASLQQNGAWVACPHGHRYPVVENVPVLLRDDIHQTIDIASESLRLARLHADGRNDDPFFTNSLGLSADERRLVRASIADAGVDPVVSYLQERMRALCMMYWSRAEQRSSRLRITAT